MEYKITDFDKRTVSITVTWDDGTTYDKRMMCDMSSEESIRSTIENWLTEYAPMREAEKEKEAIAYDPTPLINNKTIVTKKEIVNKDTGEAVFKVSSVALDSLRASVEEVV